MSRNDDSIADNASADDAARSRVSLVAPRDRVPGEPTPGMVREQAIGVDGLWSGVVRTEPGMTSGWHHHGNHETSIYVVEGTMRMEAGSGGAEVIEATAGDFIHVPRGAIHRESNPGDTTSLAVISRSGGGPVTVNVDGPEPAASG